LQAEVLVLRQQIVVLRRGRPARLPLQTIDGDGSVGYFPTLATHWPWFGRQPSCDGTVQVSGRIGAGSRSADRTARPYLGRSAS
jgi:hypothetical protein